MCRVVVASIASIVMIVAPMTIMIVAISSIVLVSISSTMVNASILVMVGPSMIVITDLLVRSRTMATMIVLPLAVLRLLLLALKDDRDRKSVV